MLTECTTRPWCVVEEFHIHNSCLDQACKKRKHFNASGLNVIKNSLKCTHEHTYTHIRLQEPICTHTHTVYKSKHTHQHTYLDTVTYTQTWTPCYMAEYVWHTNQSQLTYPCGRGSRGHIFWYLGTTDHIFWYLGTNDHIFWYLGQVLQHNNYQLHHGKSSWLLAHLDFSWSTPAHFDSRGQNIHTHIHILLPRLVITNIQ